jgi:hypothetical protein
LFKYEHIFEFVELKLFKFRICLDIIFCSISNFVYILNFYSYFKFAQILNFHSDLKKFRFEKILNFVSFSNLFKFEQIMDFVQN